jgi:hypothetical protein
MSEVFDAETLSRTARLAGFVWTAEELEILRPAVATALSLLATLDALPLDTIEPTTQYRIL